MGHQPRLYWMYTSEVIMDDSFRTHGIIDMQDAHLPCMFYPVLSQSLWRNRIEPWMTVTLISLNRV